MKLVGREGLEEFCLHYADIRKPLDAWIAEVQEAQWKMPQDIKERYVHASFLANNRVVFNLKGGRYRLDVKVSFKSQIVLVVRIGTHAEYNKWEF
jgi:mRNA interferase HigB